MELPENFIEDYIYVAAQDRGASSEAREIETKRGEPAAITWSFKNMSAAERGKAVVQMLCTKDLVTEVQALRHSIDASNSSSNILAQRVYGLNRAVTWANWIVASCAVLTLYLQYKLTFATWIKQSFDSISHMLLHNHL